RGPSLVFLIGRRPTVNLFPYATLFRSRFDTDLALGSDTIDESGGGVDTLDFSATTIRAVAINLGNAGTQVINAGLTLTLSAGNTIENVIGGALGDTLLGNALNNVIEGGGGNDVLT